MTSSRTVCSSLTSFSGRRAMIRATINIPNPRPGFVSFPNLSEELVYRNPMKLPTYDTKVFDPPIVVRKLYLIMEAVSDRVEMHKNIADQRSNWNGLLLNSINGITLAASVMAGIAATTSGTSHLESLKLSSTLLYVAATRFSLIMNKIQPSQLAEEQRNAARLFKQLQTEIQTILCLGVVSSNDLKEVMERVLALDKAYPLPLLGSMLEKFPEAVKPVSWWPHLQRREVEGELGRNGWNVELEEELRETAKVLKRKDEADYLKLGEIALKLNRVLAISGPVLTGLGAIGSAFSGTSGCGSCAVVVGIVAGALATVVNTIEHGGQVGMVFEMYRGNAGFFKLIEETIESNLQRDEGRRENGELLELKVALKLGRSLSDLKKFAASSCSKGDPIKESASKLF